MRELKGASEGLAKSLTQCNDIDASQLRSYKRSQDYHNYHRTETELSILLRNLYEYFNTFTTYLMKKTIETINAFMSTIVYTGTLHVYTIVEWTLVVRFYVTEFINSK